MTITNSSTRLVALATGVAVALALMGAAAIAPAQAAGLTQTQIQSIVSLLASFGADQATINNVTAALNGQPTSGTGGSTGGTGGACPALSRDLQQGSTGADVKALQVFFNGSADTMVAASGAGSPGNETMTFGPATKAAAMKFQTKHGITPVAGYVGAKTRAQIAAVCGGTTTTPPPGGTTGGQVSVLAAAQPVNSLAPEGSSRVPFTTFTITNNSSAAVTINSVTIERTGLAQDAAFSGVILLDSNGLQVGTSKTFNSNHQANVGDGGFTIGAGQSMTYTVAGNMASSLDSYNGQVASLKVVAINTGATVSGALPITGASQTLNSTLTVGSVSTSTSSFDPGAAQTKNLGDTDVRFSGIKFTAGSTEDLKLYSIRWRQVGSASSVDLANVVTVANGTTYPTTVDSTGKYYTTIFPGGLLITKGNSIDVYIKGDVVGTNAASRTVDFDIDKVTDVYFVGQLYGYGIAPSGTYTPWYTGYVTTLAGGTVTTISKANTGKAAAQNVAVNLSNQPMGGFTTNFTGEPVSITALTATIGTSSLTASGNALFTSVSIVDENGTVVAGPIDATHHASSGQTLSFSDTVTFPTGVHSYYLQGKISTLVTAGSFSVSTTPSSGWTNPTGQSTGNTVSLSSQSTAITFNTMTIKAGALKVSYSTSPATQNIASGVSQFNFANLLLDATQSGEDVRTSSIPVKFTGNANNLSGCQMFDGATALNYGSNVANTISPSAKTTFTLNNVLQIPKGTIKTIAVKCNLTTAATSSSTYRFDEDSTTADWSVTGNVSGVSVTPTFGGANAGTMTVATASLALTVDSSSPASSTVAGGATGQTIAVYNIKGSNDTITLTDIGVTLTSGTSASVSKLYFYNGSTLLGDLTMGSGVTTATSTLTHQPSGQTSPGLVLSPDVDYKITVKADLADVGTGKSGVNGAVIAVNPSSAKGTGSSGSVEAAGSGSTSGARLFNSYPIFTYDTTGATLINGVNTLLVLNVTAPAQGDVGLYKLSFKIATTTVTLASPTFTGPNGQIASTTLAVDVTTTAGTNFVRAMFDSTTNTSDATVSAGTTKTYTLKATISGLTGSNSGSVATQLMADTAAVAVGATSSMASSLNIFSTLATTTLNLVGNNDYANGYANRAGCFATAGLAVDCEQRVVAK